MPAIKSPGKLLQIWKQKTHAYLKVNGATAWSLRKVPWTKRFVTAWSGSARWPQTGWPPSAERFHRASRYCPGFGGRCLFKPKKTQPKVKIFYLDMSRMILVLRQLELAELDPHEDGADSLDDVDAEMLERHEQEHEVQIDAALAAGQIPAAPPSKQRRPPRPLAPWWRKLASLPN